MASIDIDNFEQINKEYNKIHCKVKSVYTKFTIENEKFFQIDMYGTNSRKTELKLSQSIQFDETSARLLVNMLCDYFEIEV